MIQFGAMGNKSNQVMSHGKTSPSESQVNSWTALVNLAKRLALLQLFSAGGGAMPDLWSGVMDCLMGVVSHVW